MLLNFVWDHHLEDVLFVLWLDSMRVDYKLLTLYPSSKPEPCVQIFFALIKYLHHTVLYFAPSKAGPQALLFRLSSHVGVKMPQNLANFTCCVDTTEHHCQDWFVPGGCQLELFVEQLLVLFSLLVIHVRQSECCDI